MLEGKKKKKSGIMIVSVLVSHPCMRRFEYKYIVAAIYAVVLFLDRLDLTIVNIALPKIAEHFHVLVTDTEWINNAFLLALSLSIPISSWLGERFGCKRVFIYATVALGLTSLLCALAPDMQFLICMRFIQGLSSGLIVPIGMTMVFRAFNPSEYASISSYIFIPSLIAPGLAPMIGGMMTDYFNWRWVFLFVTPVSFIIAGFSYWLVKECRSANKLLLDVTGFVLSASTLLLVFHVLSVIGKQGFNWNMLCELLLAMALGYLFVLQERKCLAPLVDLELFRKKLFVQANLILTLFQIGHFGSIFLIAIYLQMNVGYTAMLAGMIMGMQAFGAICSSRLSVHLYECHSAKLPISVGWIGVGVISPRILCLNPSTPVWLGFVVLFVRGLFSGLCGAPIQAIGIGGFSNEQIGQAAAAFNIVRQLSISLGISLSALLLSIAIHDYDLSILVNRDKSVFYAPFALISCSVWVGAWVTLYMDKRSLLMNHKSRP